MTTLEDFSTHVRAMAAQEQQVRALAAAAEQEQDRLRATIRELQATAARLRQAQQSQPPRPAAQPAPQPWEEKRNRYRQLIARVREAVEASVPAGAAVAVVSKGDEELLRLGGRPAEHLPQTPQGIYAGHHPANSAEAITQLESL